MATLSTRNFNRYSINNNRGSNNNCMPSIMATFLQVDTNEAERKMEGYPARTGRKYGGTKIKWNDPAGQITRSFGVPATDVVDVSTNTSYSLEKHGTLAKVVRDLNDGAYVVIHRGHAFGVLVVDNIAYTVDYGDGNAARRVVWTCTRLDNVDAREILTAFRSKCNHFKTVDQLRAEQQGNFEQRWAARLEQLNTQAAENIKRKQAAAAAEPKPTAKETFIINEVSTRTSRKEASMCCNCSVGRIAELVRDARNNGGRLTKRVKGNMITIILAA